MTLTKMGFCCCDAPVDLCDDCSGSIDGEYTVTLSGLSNGPDCPTCSFISAVSGTFIVDSCFGGTGRVLVAQYACRMGAPFNQIYMYFRVVKLTSPARYAWEVRIEDTGSGNIYWWFNEAESLNECPSIEWDVTYTPDSITYVSDPSCGYENATISISGPT